MTQQFTGAGVALITPFDSNNQIDVKALETVVQNQVKGGIDYLVALGTTAETSTLSSSEKAKVIEIVKKNAGNLPVVVGIGGNNTQAVTDTIKSTNLEGVSGILMVTPYYNRPTQEGLFRHYMAAAETSPLPIILYNVPSRTGINLEAETVVRLAEASEKFVAVKEASGSLQQITGIIKHAPENFIMISGDDGLALPTIAVGGKGLISVIANALPEKISKMVHLSMDGNFSEAAKIHTNLADLLKYIFLEGNPGGVKALMNFMGVIENELRLPLYKVSDKTRDEIISAYQKL
jgi:4-hydroxy-tetrahydrodipicolinate synthase